MKAQQAVVPVSDSQARVIALEQECETAQGRIRELLDEGQTLQNQFRELQNEKAAQVTELEGRLKVGQMEMMALIGEDIKWLNSERDGLKSKKDKLEAELKQLKDASQPATVAKTTYPPPVGSGVSPGSPFGSALPSHAQMLGHYSPNIPPYGLAATPVAYAAPGGQAQSYGSPQQPPAHQFQGSPQAQQVAMNLFRVPVGLRPESPLASGSDTMSQAVVSAPVTTSAPPT